ncbi:MAG: ABC transporter permease [Lachnospiraceae bacterium]|nr:ABC transporter permease [Lachnospiraceae bacterium]
MLAIFKREMQGYFTSMIAYLFMAGFVVVVGIYFMYYCVINGYADFAGAVLPSTCIWFSLLIPIITMRLWAEERKQKTDQLLLTAPISVTRIVLGKYLAVVTLFAITLLVLFLFPVILSFYADVAWPSVFTGFLGYLLLGCSLISIGFFISTLTENQIVSAVVSAVLVLMFFFLNNLADSFPGRARYSIMMLGVVVIGIMILFYTSTHKYLPSAIAGVLGIGAIACGYFINPSMYEDGAAKFVNWFSVLDRFYSFSDGLLNVSSIVYYLSFVGVFLFLTIRSIEKKRWN